jgi:hypothetical protein
MAGNLPTDPPCIESFDVVRNKIGSLGDQVVDLFFRKSAFARPICTRVTRPAQAFRAFASPAWDLRPGVGAKLPGGIEAINPDFPEDVVVPHIDVEQRGVVAGPSLKINNY